MTKKSEKKDRTGGDRSFLYSMSIVLYIVGGIIGRGVTNLSFVYTTLGFLTTGLAVWLIKEKQ